MECFILLHWGEDALPVRNWKRENRNQGVEIVVTGVKVQKSNGVANESVAWCPVENETPVITCGNDFLKSRAVA